MKAFVLRNMLQVNISLLGQLKVEIVKQLGSSIVFEDCDFDVGYIKGQTKVFFHLEEEYTRILCSLKDSHLIVSRV